MRRTVVTLFVLAVLVPPPLAWADDAIDRMTLKGIRSVMVLVDSLRAPGAERIALAGEIRTEVELALRQVGLRVAGGFGEMSLESGYPMVHVSIEIMGQAHDDGELPYLYFYMTRVALYQSVLLERKPGVSTHASTWQSSGYLGYVGLGRLTSIRSSIRAQLNEFLNAYLAANPKPASSR